jgi:hypothetical protein
MLLLGGRALNDRTIGFCGTRARGGRGLEAADVAASGQRQRRAHEQYRRTLVRTPKPAAHPALAPSLNVHHYGYSFPRGLVPAKQLNLPHPEHINSRPAMRLNETPNPNPAILEGLRQNAGRLEPR